MKIRGAINSNVQQYAGTIYEHGGKIGVIKRDTFNHFDCSTDERFEFSTADDFRAWLKAQDWIVKITYDGIPPMKSRFPWVDLREEARS